jgi:SnoaL-like domain
MKSIATGIVVAMSLGAITDAHAQKHSAADEIVALLQTLSYHAIGDNTKKVPDGTKPLRIAIGPYGGVNASPGAYPEPDPYPVAGISARVKQNPVALSSDAKSGWVTADVQGKWPCAVIGCKENTTTFHATMVFEADRPWHPVALDLANPHSGKDAAKLGAPPAITRQIDAGAEEAAKLFESTIGDVKALTATVSDRKEAVLFGSELAEKYVGTAAIKSTLTRWNLTFKVRDGVQAGVTSDKTLAWVAANVDATSAKTPTAKPTPYVALFVYEKVDTTWRLVVAQFSVYEPTS